MTVIKVKNVRNLKFHRWDIKEIVIKKKYQALLGIFSILGTPDES